MRCKHKNTVTRMHHDPGGGQDHTIPRTWYTIDCTKCDAPLYLKGDRSEDEWREVPKGSKNTPYGVAFPNDYIYDH